MSGQKINMVMDNPIKVFFYYCLPSVLGMLAISSAGAIDAIFVGNFVGSSALAAINLIFPYYSLLFGFGVMIVTGSSVRCGKYMGEGNRRSASAIFTKTMIAIIISCIVIMMVGILFPENIVRLLGANEELTPDASLYLSIISSFVSVFIGAYALSIFVRIDGRPVLSSVSMIAGALCNVILDWWLIMELGMGVRGAAIATGGSQLINLFILLPHFFSRKAELKFRLDGGSWKEIWSACYNGLSELTNELSMGLVLLVFNWIIISRLGVPGVAAFTIINHTFWFGLMIAYGISESMLPVISTNLGARLPDRIKYFLILANSSAVGVGIVLFIFFTAFPEKLIGFFLKSNEFETIQIALSFTDIIKWAFFFSGINIILSAYFTAMHRPMESVVVALSRSLVLPVLALTILPLIYGNEGLYIAIPFAEAVTFFLALFLFLRNRPVKLVNLLGHISFKKNANISSAQKQ
jgi:putative MATE family efflux protein